MDGTVEPIEALDIEQIQRELAAKHVAHELAVRTRAPIEDRLLVRQLEEAETSQGGIIVKPATARKKLGEGIVLRAGKGRWLIDGRRMPMDVKEGDRVYYQHGIAGYELEIDGEMLIVLREQEVLLRVETE